MSEKQSILTRRELCVSINHQETSEYPPDYYAPDQEIVYRDESRYTYRTLNERIGRLANALTKTGVGRGGGGGGGGGHGGRV